MSSEYREQYDPQAARRRLARDSARSWAGVPIYNPYAPRRAHPSQVGIRWLSPKRSLALYAWEAFWLAAVVIAAGFIFK